MEKLKIICIDIDTGPYSSFLTRIVMLGKDRVSAYVCVANVHMLVEAFKNKMFAEIVNDADLVTPDGMPIAQSLLLLHGIKQERVAGMDLVPDLISACEKENLSVFIYGSTNAVLSAVLHRISREHPGLTVAGVYSPPFRPITAAEAYKEIADINQSGANLVLVALGCPKQEIWMAANRGRVNAVMVGIGGALPVYAGLQRRAPVVFQRLALEWFYRLCQEPRRLFKRYCLTNTLFMILLGRELMTKIFR